MQPLPATLISAKNALEDGGAWIILIEVEYTSGNFFYFAANQNADVTWNGHTWQWMPIELDAISEAKGEVPQLNARICNVDRMVQQQIEQYNGAIDQAITIYCVHSANLAQTTNIPTFPFTITGCKCDANWVTFTMGITPSPYIVPDPKDQILKNFCRYKYGNSNDTRCPYTGPFTGNLASCDRTLATCKLRNPSAAQHFGGFPAIGSNRLYS